MQGPIPKLSIDQLIEIVRAGGKIRTGIDIFNKQGRLILEKDVIVDDEKPLLNVKRFGVDKIPIIMANAGGLWDKDGKAVGTGETAGTGETVATKPIQVDTPPKRHSPAFEEKKVVRDSHTEIDRKIEELIELKGIASKKYAKAKDCIKQVLASIQDSGGKFDFDPIANTVSELFEFVSLHENAFSYLTKEIFSYDDYLYNHSINVCTIGTVILKKFNENFSGVINNTLTNSTINIMQDEMTADTKSFSFYLPDEMRDISIGFFMHDLGKVLIDKNILNKPGKLTDSEFEEIKSHSTSKGLELLEKNKMVNPYVKNISLYHHARLFESEERCYPDTKAPKEIPPYVKICKLADIYDAMTSKRCYKEALNPVGVVADIFHKYAEKDHLLQYILHSFVKSVGIYPPGSVVALTNGQLAYILDSEGPNLLPISDTDGATLQKKQDILVMVKGVSPTGIKIDRRKPPLAPTEAFKMLPDYLMKHVFSEKMAS